MRSRHEAICFNGEPIGDAAGPCASLRLGIALVPEGRRLFPSLTVEENLVLGGQLRPPGPWTLERVYALFPVLEERRRMPSTGAVRRPAADGRHRPRPDVQSRAAAAATKSAWASRRSSSSDIYARLPRDRRAKGARRDHRRAGHRPGAAARRTTSIACRRAASRSKARPPSSPARPSRRAYFGV